MAVVGLAVLFAGILSPQIAAATIAALLTFVLPVAVAAPDGQIGPRLAGWALAGALALPAILLVWPRPYRDELRRQLSATARALGALVAIHAEGRLDRDALTAAEAALGALRTEFVSTTYPPTGAAPSDAAVAKLVGRMAWVGTNAVLGQRQAAVLGLPDVTEVNRAVAEVLEASGRLIGDDEGHPVRDRAAVERLQLAVAELRARRLRSQELGVDRLLDGTAQARARGALEREGTAIPSRLAGTRSGPDDRLLEVLDPTFRTRALAFAALMVADGTL